MDELFGPEYLNSRIDQLDLENSVLRTTIDNIRDICQQILARDEHDSFAYAQRLLAEDVLAQISEGREMMLP